MPPPNPPPDRIELLRAQTALTGLDFVFVHGNQTRLDVFFLVDPRDLDVPLQGSLTLDQVTIRDARPGGEVFPITGLSWVTINNRQAMRLDVPFPGGFQIYDLAVNDARMDSEFDRLPFNFKAGCESDLDCRPPALCCPEDETLDVLPNYLARDFWALRGALMDFAAERWSDWKDRLAADGAVMMAELFAALGDEFAYVQDQIAHESHLSTANERRSLRQLARLVDYEIGEGAAASGWLTVTANADGDLVAGTVVEAASDSGPPVRLEVGRGLYDADAGTPYPVALAANALDPYIWDEDPPETPVGEPGPLWPPGRQGPPSCLMTGTTELWLDGHHAADLALTDLTRDPPGRWVLLRSDPANPAEPARRWPVRLVEVRDDTDPLPPGAAPVTFLRWEEAQALPLEINLSALTLAGNLVPITAGESHTVLFSTGAVAAGTELARTVERDGPDKTTRHLMTLPKSDVTPLTRLGEIPALARPEVMLSELEWNGAAWVRIDPPFQWDVARQDWSRPSGWSWRRSLLGVNSSLAEANHYTLDDGHWRAIVRHWRQAIDYQGRNDAGGPARFEGDRLTHYDLAIGNAATIRFGDCRFGRLPPEGMAFECRYRLGNGRPTNVAAETVTVFVDPPGTPGFVDAISNPFPTTGGADPETPESVRRRAPSLYKYVAFRAVKEADYREAAERLSWVQQAGAKMRWTGSWLSVFATADPLGELTLSAARQAQLGAHLDAFRQAGREVHVRPPRYGNIDLDIGVCVAPGYDRGTVKVRILEALFGGCNPTDFFFSPDRFTFGTPLWRSALEAAIHSVVGVRAVGDISIRRRGVFDWKVMETSYEPLADDEILRLANDPTRPERGTVNLKMEGGA